MSNICPVFLPGFEMIEKPGIGHNVDAAKSGKGNELLHKVIDDRFSGHREQGFWKIFRDRVHAGRITGAQNYGVHRSRTPFTEFAR